MWDILINAAISIVSVYGAVIFTRSKYKAEVDKLRTEIESARTANRNAEVDLLKNASQTLMDNVVKPLENELNKMRRAVGSLQKAIQRLYDCTHVADCPVRKQLQCEESGNGDSDTKPS